VDMGKHPGASPPVTGLPQLKHDMMYHHSMNPHHPSHNARPHQVMFTITLTIVVVLSFMLITLALVGQENS